jgi:predicted amidohydrolase
MVVGIVQVSSVYLNLAESMLKATELIREAASQGAELVVFGETWLPGYPAWWDYCPEAALWDHRPTKEIFASLRENSIVVPGQETETLAQLAKELEIVVTIGVNEKIETGLGNGTLYNSLLTIDTEGRLINHHRKLIPTYTERLVWGQGDAMGLKAVETSLGRVGGLICWEHWMPLSRQTLHNSGEHVHIAVWPSVKEMHQIASRHYAFEGRCFVLAAGLIMAVRDLPAQLKVPAELAENPDQLVLNGGSAIIAPDGRYVAGPVYDEETILVAEIDLTEIYMERMTLDTAGHYSRPDIFDFRVNQNRPG